MPTEETTTNRGYQKPYSTNELSVDVARLRSALDAIDTDVDGLFDKSIARATSQATISLSNGATGTTTITLPKSGILTSIGSDKAALVILYSTAAAATADAGRSWATVAPTAGSGVIAQVTLAGSGTQALDPAPAMVNREGTPSTTYTIRVTNNGITGDVVITLGYVKLEP